jgi:hypothetical protein
MTEGVTTKHIKYLDDLRESGSTNMFGAGRYLQNEFGLDRDHASRVLNHWMETFDPNIPAEDRQ